MKCAGESPETSVGRADGGYPCPKNAVFTCDCGTPFCTDCFLAHVCPEPRTGSTIVDLVALVERVS